MVLYNINGRYLRELEVFVSRSEGIGSVLKRKPVASYDWPEYNGLSVDLSAPRYEARQITLDCFILGGTWQEMLYRFNSIIRDEFSKPGLQRLMIEFPLWGYDPLIYQVYMQEDAQLEKTFKEGRMAGTFKLQLIEPNPLKRVYYTTSDKITLNLTGVGEYDIFWPDGSVETFHDSYSVTDKQLPNRQVSGYHYPGRNCFTGGLYPLEFAANDVGTLVSGVAGTVNGKEGVIYQAAQGKNISMYAPNYVKNLQAGKTYVFSCWIEQRSEDAQKTVFFQLSGGFFFSQAIPYYSYVRVVKEFVYTGGNNFISISADSNTLDIAEISITEKNSGYKVAPENENYIVIAGNIDALNSTANAKELWAKL